jgi:hypothetical protein
MDLDRGNQRQRPDNVSIESGEDGDEIDDLLIGKKFERKMTRGNASLRIVKSVKGPNLKTLKGLDKGFERRNTTGH